MMDSQVDLSRFNPRDAIEKSLAKKTGKLMFPQAAKLSLLNNKLHGNIHNHNPKKATLKAYEEGDFKIVFVYFQ